MILSASNKLELGYALRAAAREAVGRVSGYGADADLRPCGGGGPGWGTAGAVWVLAAEGGGWGLVGRRVFVGAVRRSYWPSLTVYVEWSSIAAL